MLEPCSSVHTFFMRFPIDVVYVDRSNRVMKLAPALKPYRVSGTFRAGCTVVELPSGTIAASGTARGDDLTFED